MIKHDSNKKADKAQPAISRKTSSSKSDMSTRLKKDTSDQFADRVVADEVVSSPEVHPSKKLDKKLAAVARRPPVTSGSFSKTSTRTRQSVTPAVSRSGRSKVETINVDQSDEDEEEDGEEEHVNDNNYSGEESEDTI